MYLMSSSMVLCHCLSFNSQNPLPESYLRYKSCEPISLWGNKRRKRFWRFVPSAEKNNNNSHTGNNKRRRSWWQRFFFDDEGNWLGLRDDEIVDEASEVAKDDEMSDEEKFETWKRRAEAIVELREGQEEIVGNDDVVNGSNVSKKKWEDWIVDSDDTLVESWTRDSAGSEGIDDNLELDELRIPDGGLVKMVRDMVLGAEEEDILYEDRVFRYASSKSAKFLAVLILIPWALDFLAHDYVLMPFLDRYVKTVPLAAQTLDVRRNQKLEMVKDLNREKARYRLEVEIGKSPPLSDDELWWEMRGKALELRDEWRLENRKAFANIWSDMVFGISLFVLLYANQGRVALLKFTGYKIINNISDTGKAFLIILITDIFLGYHSESGWETLLEIIMEHYGLEVEQSTITIFICLVPVIMDACVKLWLFKFLPRLSPRVSNIFQEMKRH
ncbi:PREDICTED: chloroplast envelope membrane protein [Camelina sativa]|uniref:Chloroplast envelope membrane protein n=1 Tax=Camelina sativa TaxID=90675 RepID=A0ABM0U9Y0_CAMSA|nr:PREDICTED: chloroplast envelope membrane protein [Camelina sativa]